MKAKTRRYTIRPFKGPAGKFDPRARRGKREGGGLRVNKEIFAPQVRLIDENGQMVGVMPVREALSIAEGRGLDLIEIAPNANPPTCKIMDYGKYKYENKKKEKEARKKQTVITVKEIQVRPRTDDHDIEVKVRNAIRFLLDGNKVKVNLRFMGREMAHQEFGMATLKRVQEKLSALANVEVAPKLEGRQAFLLMAPDPVKIKEYLKNQEKPEEQTESSEAPAESNEE